MQLNFTLKSRRWLCLCVTLMMTSAFVFGQTTITHFQVDGGWSGNDPNGNAVIKWNIEVCVDGPTAPGQPVHVYAPYSGGETGVVDASSDGDTPANGDAMNCQNLRWFSQHGGNIGTGNARVLGVVNGNGRITPPGGLIFDQPGPGCARLNWTTFSRDYDSSGDDEDHYVVAETCIGCDGSGLAFDCAATDGNNEACTVDVNPMTTQANCRNLVDCDDVETSNYEQILGLAFDFRSSDGTDSLVYNKEDQTYEVKAAYVICHHGESDYQMGNDETNPPGESGAVDIIPDSVNQVRLFSNLRSEIEGPNGLNLGPITSVNFINNGTNTWFQPNPGWETGATQFLVDGNITIPIVNDDGSDPMQNNTNKTTDGGCGTFVPICDTLFVEFFVDLDNDYLNTCPNRTFQRPELRDWTPFNGYQNAGSDPGEFTPTEQAQRGLNPDPENLDCGTAQQETCTAGPAEDCNGVAIDVICEDCGLYSLGSTVFNDPNNNAMQDPGEMGIEGVTVNLYDDVDGDGMFSAADTLVATTVTDMDGNYFFDNLNAQDYIVGVVPPSDNPFSSNDDIDEDDPNTNVESDDNGSQPNGQGTEIYSNAITLSNDEPESGDGNEGAQGSMQDDDFDTGGNMTLDFGLFPGMSLGSTVWEDSNNSGTQDGTEMGVAGVTVELYDDVDGNGVFSAGDTLVATTMTDMNGDYFFDNLAEGDYIVGVIPPNDLPLSSTGLMEEDPDDNDTDSDDNGIQAESGDPIYSQAVTLIADMEPQGAAEGGSGGMQDGADNSPEDANGNMTVDFGLIPGLSIGSTVFADNDNDGIHEPDDGEDGIGGVLVILFEDGIAIDSTFTDGNGDYFFDGLPEGTYTVGIPMDVFGAGEALENFPNSSTDIATSADPNNDTDEDDNGLQSGGTGTVVMSGPIELSIGGEPQGTAEGGSGGMQDGADNSPEDANGNMTVDFGFYPNMSIGSTVWSDEDGDGTQNGMEMGVEGVEVFLIDPGPDGIPGTADDVQLDMTTTDMDGNYLFDTLPPGDYVVAIVPPDTLNRSSIPTDENDNGQDGDDNGIQDMPGDTIYSPVVSLDPGDEPTTEPGEGGMQDDGVFDNDGDMTVDFGLIPSVSVGSTVWLDLDNSGTYEEGMETPVEGVVVRLYEDADGDGVPDGPAIAVDTTDAMGNYFFDDLLEGMYVVGVTPPDTAELSSRPTTVGDDNGAVDNDDNGIQDAPGDEIFSSSITLTSNDEVEGEPDSGGDQDIIDDNNGDMTVDFGLIPSVSLGSTVFADLNNDGMQGDPMDEPGVSGVPVELYLDSDGDGMFTPGVDSLIATTTTDADGNYFFDGLYPGEYIVGITPPADLPLSSDGAMETDPDDNVDSDDDGIQENSGDPIYSQAITLAPNTEPEDESGQGGDQDEPNDNDGNMTVDFGLYPGVSIGSTVFADNDNDGMHEPGDGENGIPGVLVILFDDAGMPVDSTITDSNGDYFFGGLPEGTYTVGIPADAFGSDEGLENYPNSSTDIATSGADNQTDEDDNGMQPGGSGTVVMSPPIELTIGEEPIGAAESGSGGTQDENTSEDDLDANGDMTVDFGFYPNMSIGSTVFADTDNSGTQDPGEDGVADVEVFLIDPGPDGIVGTADDMQLAMTTTDMDGNYVFDSLPPGDYVVAIVPPDTLNTSSTPTNVNDDGMDGDDNGIQEMSGDTIFSPVVSLVPGMEPEDEPGQGGDQETGGDDNGDMTVDFGLIPSVSVGSTVWLDIDNSGTYEEGTEDPLEGIIVRLYEDADGDGVPDGPAIAVDTTDGMGNYFFDGLPEGMYVIGVTPPDSIDLSSEPTVDMDDNGAVDNDDNGIQESAGDEILSPSITLTANDETEGETGSGGDQDVADDNNGDMTVDFGLIPSVSLGSTVFADLNNDGMQGDPNDEPGVADVVVELYLDSDGDGMFTPGVDSLIATTTTDADGNYFFDGLYPGDYIVGITPPDNLPLSSDGAMETDPDDNMDGDDDGIQENSGDPIYSQAVTLAPDTEPEDEAGQGGDQDEPNDNDGNMTVDFGLYPGLSIGSTVFSDPNDDGIHDPGAGENGIPGVLVILFDDAGNPIDSTITDSNGDYFFGGLPEGTYTVGIPADAFGPDEGLEGYPNSSTDIASTADPNNDLDEDDNGMQPGGAGTVVMSGPITLTVDGEPTGGAESGSGGTQDDIDDDNGNMTIDFGFRPLDCPIVEISILGDPELTCGDSLILEIDIIPSDSMGVWSTDGTGTLTEMMSGDGGQTTYIPGDMEDGEVLIIFTVNAQDPDCTTNSDTVAIWVINDTIPPMFVNCPSDTLTVGNDVDNCDGGAIWPIPVAEDNCCIDTVEQTVGPPPGSILPVGVTEIQYVASDKNGNTDTCTFFIEVIDTQEPLLVCPKDMTMSNDEGMCSWQSPMDALNPLLARENCEGDLQHTITLADDAMTMISDTGFVMPTVFPVGVNEICYTLSDSSGAQMEMCCFTVTVEDNEAPEIAFCNDLGLTVFGSDVLSVNAGTCQFMGPGEVEITDNCQDVVDVFIIVTNPSGLITTDTLVSQGANSYLWDATLDKGLTTYEFVVRDSSGNETRCTGQAEVLDTELPTIDCSAIDGNRSADAGECSFTMPGAGFDPVYMDNCPDSTITHDYALAPDRNTLAGAEFPVGTTEVVWTVTDCGGNTASCMITVVVTDDEAPQITNCPAAGEIVQDTDDGLCEATVNFSNITGIDNCSPLDSLTIEYMLSGGLTQDWTEGQATGLVYPLDTTVVSYRITDSAGNVSDTCVFNVIIVDNQAPDAICRDIEVFLDANGEAVITVDSVDGGSFDNCGIETLLPEGDLMYDCSDLGFNTVTLVAIDSSGNQDSCVAVVTVRDTIPPTFECPADMTVDGCSGTVPDLITGLTGMDNCDDVVFEQNPRPNVTFGPDANDTIAVKITATDGSGNMTMCEVILTIIDDENPYFQNCPDSLVYNNDVDDCGAIVNWLAPVAFDNCDDSLDVTQIRGGLPGSFFPVGVDTITYEAVDDDGNRIECTFPVIVIDNQTPTAVCKDIDVIVSSECEVTIFPEDVDAGSTDNCEIELLEISIDGVTYMDSITFNQADLDPSMTTVWLRVVDIYGNSSICTADIEVFDVDDPMVVCQDDITIFTEPDVCYGIVPDVLPPFDTSDNCIEIPEINQVPQAGVIWGSKPGDSLEIFVEVVDTDGNRDTCSLFAVLVDTMRPHFINCPRPTINVKSFPGMCGAFVNFSLPVAEDNCVDLEIRKLDDTGLTSGDMFPVGATVLSWIAEDASGNLSDTCRIKIIVNDSEAPSLECPADVTVGTDPGACEATVRGIGPVIEDQCPDNVLTVYTIVNTESGEQIASGFEDASGELFGCGENVVTYRTQDHPLVLITEVTHELESAVGGTDPVPGFITANTIAGDDYVEVTNFGPNAIELNCLVLYRTSVNGVDSIMVPFDREELASGGVAVFHFGEGIESTADHFYVDSLSSDLASGDGASYELRFEGGVIDAVAVNGATATNFSGNIASTDGTAGVIREFVWDTDSADDWYVAEGCREQTMGTYNPDYPAAVDNGSSPAVGLQSFTNEGAECTFTVTVEDTELPECGMLLPNVYTDQGGTVDPGCNEFTISVGESFEVGEVILPDLSFSSVADLSATLTSPSGTEGSVDILNIPDTLFDFNGEDSAGDWILSVSNEGTVSQTLSAWTLQLWERAPYNRPDTIVDNDPGLCSAEVTYNAPELFDNCDVGNILVSYETDDDIALPMDREVVPGAPITEVFGVGTTDITFTLFDKAGNSSTCGFSVTVEDVEPPVVVCPDDITVDLEGGECDAIVNFIPESAEDNCSIDTIYSFPPSGSVFPIGVTEVLLIVEDPAGNSDSCTFNVIVNEYVPEDESLICLGTVNVSLDENCQACISPDEILSGTDYRCFDDYCVELEDFDGNILPDSCIGLDQVGDSLYVRVIDCSGNQVECWGYLVVEDKLIPEIECPADITVACNEATDTTVTGSAQLRSCESGAVITFSDEEFHNGDCGTPRVLIERTWVITDDSGNSNSCVQTITVDNANLDDIGFPEDISFADGISCIDVASNPAVTEPVFTGVPTIKGKSVYEDSEFCELNVGYWDEILPDVDCDAAYAILRNWIVLDKCQPAVPGINPRRHIQTIHVIDQTPPMVTCNEDITIAVDAHNCFTLFDPMDYAPEVTDACSDIVSVELVGGFNTTVLPLGEHTFTYRVQDDCGNKATCSFNVTVVDRTVPVVVCETFREVSLLPDGTAKVEAEAFDDGSYDNCNPVWFKVRRMQRGLCDGINGDDSTNPGYQEWYDDYVKFCCDDINRSDVTVILRVYDKDPGAGPIPPTGSQSLEGHWNECMIEVNVEDKLPPTIVCPADVTINCDDPYELDNLSQYGEPFVSDACEVTWDERVIPPSDCSAAQRVIRRVFTATDAQGLTSQCIQNIFLVDPQPFEICDTESRLAPLSPSCDNNPTGHTRRDGVEWPADIELTTCMGGLSPEDLKANPSVDNRDAMPTIIGGGCAQIAMDYEDEEFAIVDDACLKVIRTWSIIDWCQFDAVTRDPEDPDRFLGRWDYIQIIKLNNTIAPEVSNCEDLEVCDDAAESCDALLDFTLLVSDDCTPEEEIEVTWRLDVDNDGSYDLSGDGASITRRIPLGEHAIQWRVEDGCDNFTICNQIITATDCKLPTPYCDNGVATVVMPSTGSIEVWANDLDEGSFDNCTAQEDLVFTIRRVGDTNAPRPAITLTCDDITDGISETVEVEIHVTDEAGNSDLCVTYILLQDTPDADNPEGVCADDPGVPLVGGDVETESGRNVQYHSVRMLNTVEDQVDQVVFTSVNGEYAFTSLTDQESRSVMPYRNNDASNGLSTLDLIGIQRHILGVDLLDSPYKMIAADVDDNQNINVLDLLDLQQVLLGLRSEFRNNLSWRYSHVDEPPTMNDPYSYVEEVGLGGLSSVELMDIDFTAIKIGDVNGDAQTSGVYEETVEIRGAGLTLLVDPSEVKYDVQSGLIHVPVRSENYAEILGYQMSIGYDASWRFMGIEPGALSITEDHVYEPVSGELVTNWYEATGRTIGSEEILFTLTFVGDQSDKVSSLGIANKHLTAESYYGEGSVQGLTLRVGQRDAGLSIFTLEQNDPNPWVDQTVIRYTLPSDMDVSIQILSGEGVVLFTAEQSGVAGRNTYTLDAEDVGNYEGVMYYRVETSDYTGAKKMIRVAD